MNKNKFLFFSKFQTLDVVYTNRRIPTKVRDITNNCLKMETRLEATSFSKLKNVTYLLDPFRKALQSY